MRSINYEKDEKIKKANEMGAEWKVACGRIVS